MKLQLRPGALRLRVDEAELQRLLDGEELSLALRHSARVVLELRVRLADTAALALTEIWRLRLPRSAVLDYVQTLPRRDALVVAAQGAGDDALHLEFEVDVRDSISVRGARRKSAPG